MSFVERERTCEYRITSAVTDKAFDFYAVNDLEGQFYVAVRLVRALYMAFYQHFFGMSLTCFFKCHHIYLLFF